MITLYDNPGNYPTFNLRETEAHLASEEEKSSELADFLFKPVPFDIEEDQPEGRKKFAPFYQQMALMAACAAGTVIFPAPLNMACSDSASLVAKNSLRTVEQSFENKRVQLKLEGQDPGFLLNHITYLKYGVLFATIVSMYGVDVLMSQYHQPNLKLWQTAAGISLKTLDRELLQFLKGKSRDATGAKIVVERSLKLKTMIFTAFLATTIATVSSGGSPILADGLLNETSTSFKFLSKELKGIVKWPCLFLGTVGGYTGDYVINGLLSKKWIGLRTFFKQDRSVLGPIGLVLTLKTAQRELGEWQIGEDDEDDEENGKKKEGKAILLGDEPPLLDPSEELPRQKVDEIRTTAPLWQQAFVVTALMTCAVAVTFWTIQTRLEQSNHKENVTVTNETIKSSTSWALLSNAVDQTAWRMSVNMVQQLPHSAKIALGSSAAFLTAQTVAYPFQNNFPLWAAVALTILAIGGARLSDKLIKNYQLGRSFTIKKKDKVIGSIFQEL